MWAISLQLCPREQLSWQTTFAARGLKRLTGHPACRLSPPACREGTGGCAPCPPPALSVHEFVSLLLNCSVNGL